MLRNRLLVWWRSSWQTAASHVLTRQTVSLAFQGETSQAGERRVRATQGLDEEKGISAMSDNMEALYQQRLQRYVTALRNGKPDRVPVRPLAAEFVATYAGYTCQEITQDYTKAFDAVCKCANEFQWDACVGNMVYVWTALTQAMGLKYYASPGVEISADTAFQYLEPPAHAAHMLPEEYDALIEDPTAFLFNTWFPRVSNDVNAPGDAVTFRHNMALVKGGMSMLQYFGALGQQNARLRAECGTPPAIGGMLKAPMDIIADKLRGYIGLTEDLLTIPEKVKGAAQALVPHLTHMAVALSGADPERNAPVAFWMHRGCVPFVKQEHFDAIYWPTLKQVIEGIWSQGLQTLFYAEGDWTAHLESFAELPEKSIVFHLDQSDPLETQRVLGKKFCITGGVPNALLAYGTEEEVRAKCKELIDLCAPDGGYCMDASAIMQNDSKPENVRAMTDFTVEYGKY